MSVDDVVAMLHGREIRNEVTANEAFQFKEAGIVVVYGASDDLCEFRGAIHDEAGCYNGGELRVASGFILEPHENCECDYCGYKNAAFEAQVITAKWCDSDIPWTYQTEVPHATFDVMEDGDVYCRGIVFKLEDV